MAKGGLLIRHIAIGSSANAIDNCTIKACKVDPQQAALDD